MDTTKMIKLSKTDLVGAGHPIPVVVKNLGQQARLVFHKLVKGGAVSDTYLLKRPEEWKNIDFSGLEAYQFEPEQMSVQVHEVRANSPEVPRPAFGSVPEVDVKEARTPVVTNINLSTPTEEKTAAHPAGSVQTMSLSDIAAKGAAAINQVAEPAPQAQAVADGGEEKAATEAPKSDEKQAEKGKGKGKGRGKKGAATEDAQEK